MNALSLGTVKKSFDASIQYMGVPEKVLIKNFNSDLFITLIHTLKISLDSVHL